VALSSGRQSSTASFSSPVGFSSRGAFRQKPKTGLCRPKAAAMHYQTLTTCRFQPRGKRWQPKRSPPSRPSSSSLKTTCWSACLLADMLCEIGYTVAADAASVDEALEATRKTDFDLAILDVDLKGRSVSPVADALTRLGEVSEAVRPDAAPG
jgi:hypothetical protein